MTIPIALTIKPSRGMSGDYVYATDSAALLRLLKESTDLPAAVLKRFEFAIHTSSFSKLLGVDLKDSTLEEIGYFID